MAKTRKVAVERPKIARKPKALVADTVRRAEIDTETKRALSELERLLTAKRVVVENLEKHTGLFGTGFFKQSDPENEKLLGDIKAEIVVARVLVDESHAALASLEDAIRSRTHKFDSGKRVREVD